MCTLQLGKQSVCAVPSTRCGDFLVGTNGLGLCLHSVGFSVGVNVWQNMGQLYSFGYSFIGKEGHGKKIRDPAAKLVSI